MDKATRLKYFLQTLGPGILFASTAIGVSHLVQSTRAGALFGMALLWAVVLANLFKYPFFEFGSRYAGATGESIIDGYRRQGRWMLWLYFGVTLCTMFFVAAAVGAVTAAFLDHLFGLSARWAFWQPTYTTLGLFTVCLGVLFWGRYQVLDRLIKVIGTVLLLSTVAAVFITLWQGPVVSSFTWFEPEALSPGSEAFVFLIALMGWMPTAVDLSAWNSLWTIERQRDSGHTAPLRSILQEFNIGYLVSAILGPCFLLLGAYLLYGSGQSLPEGSAGFAARIVGLYTSSIGDWSRLIITASAFSIMFGTSIAVFDGYGRSMERLLILLRTPQPAQQQGGSPASSPGTYRLTTVIVGSGALLIIFLLGDSLKELVDVATTISFLVAPLIATVNLRLVTSRHMPAAGQPPRWLRWLSYGGIVFLTGFALVYLFL